MAYRDVNCGPCKRDGKISTPAVYCVKCEEFICDDCIEGHRELSKQGHLRLQYIASTDEDKYLPNINEDIVSTQCESSEKLDQTDKKYNSATDVVVEFHDGENTSDSKDLVKSDITEHEHETYLIKNSDNKEDDSSNISALNSTDTDESISRTQTAEMENTDVINGQISAEDDVRTKKEGNGNADVSIIKSGTQRGFENSLHTTENAQAVENHLCDPCKYGDVSRKASLFCAQCQEKLCDQCIKVHKGRKTTRYHELVTVPEIKEQQCLKCDPCTFRDQITEALYYCKVCEEHLCELCMNVHRKSKATANHKTVKIEDLNSYQAVRCDVCVLGGKSNTAVLFCKVCDENLCTPCGDAHRNRKATKGHQLNDIKQILSKEDYCDICIIAGQSQIASSYCEDCEEQLCQPCSDQHKRRKATKNHELIDINATKSSALWESDILCSTCQSVESKLFATNFCALCDEFYCTSCLHLHMKNDETNQHTTTNIADFMQRVNVKITCDPCKSKTDPAVFYCEECDENLCEPCSNYHKIFKSTKEHSLLNVMEQLLRTVSIKQPCDNCYNQNGFVIATFSCKECKLYLCNICSSQHLIQAVTKSHHLTSLEEKSRENWDGGNGNQTSNATSPGIPIAEYISTSEIKIFWKRPEKSQGEISHYDIRFRESGAPKWRVFSTETSNEWVAVSDLKCDTVYQFKVRAIYGDTEGTDSLISNEIKTKLSLAREVIEFSIKLDAAKSESDGPDIYKIPIEENPNCRNLNARTRKCTFGNSANEVQNKTIMVIGATGAGKTTLIDGMINYIFDVSWEDDFRFSIIDLMDDEKEKHLDQTQSQTEWITCYTVHWMHGSQIPYNLNIIDTPGFGDTRGIDRDNRIVEQIRELFTLSGNQGISVIDGVCFVTQAPLARLTALQRYIIDSILSIFGRDIIGNIFALITFADGKTPPVLEALQSADVPFGASFIFNNSALFAPNKSFQDCSFSPMFWKMGRDSFKTFFDHLSQVQPRSLQLTSEVLQERQQLEILVQGLRPQIDEGLSKIETLRQENRILKRHRYDIEHNRNFTYEVDKTCQRKVDLQPGVHVTNCLTCNRTCHDRCIYADDADKIKCSSMQDGFCTVCPEQCIWNVHKNNPYKFEFYTEKVTGTYDELKSRYESAQTGALKQGEIILKIKEEVNALSVHVGQMVEHMRISINRLSEIALKPNPLSSVDYIDLLIESERQEKTAGYLNRICVLRTYRKNAELVQNLPSGNYLPFGDIDLENLDDTPDTHPKRQRKKGIKDKFLDFFR